MDGGVKNRVRVVVNVSIFFYICYTLYLFDDCRTCLYTGSYTMYNVQIRVHKHTTLTTFKRDLFVDRY